MKKQFLVLGAAILMSCTLLNAQETEPATPATPANPTVEAITSKYQMTEMPEALTLEKVFPALGAYQSKGADGLSLKISLDENSKGVIWIEGFSQGKVKAILQKSPATYKIPAQKTEEGNDIQEGTLVYDKDANQLNICLGRKFNFADPASSFAVAEEKPETAKGKKAPAEKVWFYTGEKLQVTTASVDPM